MTIIQESELILNPDGSIYHLNLLPEDIADTIITVGDPDRVAEVSKYFDQIELKKQRREFVTHTGFVGKKRISVISTGISTDNIDIVFNELDALVNIDLKARTIKPQLTSLNFIRIGTAGGLQKNIPVDTTIISEYAIGLDGLGSFYQMQINPEEKLLHSAFLQHFSETNAISNSYISRSSTALMKILEKDCVRGITVTCGGFYGPQGRVLRGQPAIPNLIQKLQSFDHQDKTIANFEMETAGIYAVANLLGHNCCSLSTLINNRATGEFSKNTKQAMEDLIKMTLEKVANS